MDQPAIMGHQQGKEAGLADAEQLNGMSKMGICPAIYKVL